MSDCENPEIEEGVGWGSTRLEIQKDELQKVMARMQMLSDPFDAMESLWEDKSFTDVIRLIQICQIANDEIKKGRKNADEVFTHWDGIKDKFKSFESAYPKTSAHYESEEMKDELTKIKSDRDRFRDYCTSLMQEFLALRKAFTEFEDKVFPPMLDFDEPDGQEQYARLMKYLDGLKNKTIK